MTNGVKKITKALKMCKEGSIIRLKFLSGMIGPSGSICIAPSSVYKTQDYIIIIPYERRNVKRIKDSDYGFIGISYINSTNGVVFPISIAHNHQQFQVNKIKDSKRGILGENFSFFSIDFEQQSKTPKIQLIKTLGLS